ncbi:hypothetical protein X798_03801 [Onchocerca flexuosa]|uniref:Uncharacterized protein n=2 Tax=Onchocerca flexuosa TaxID=387005 RepID=A0A183HZ07_9BILA|nr:hypothetical protein X798_03801 [Onchocerca flexuosa]VDP11997.1 unnamed protein product [Onchocerca flexuosa]
MILLGKFHGYVCVKCTSILETRNESNVLNLKHMRNNVNESNGQLNERLPQHSVHDQVEKTTCEYRKLTAIQFKRLPSRYQCSSFTHRCLIGSKLTLSCGE